jgi:hypothetical protein
MNLPPKKTKVRLFYEDFDPEKLSDHQKMELVKCRLLDRFFLGAEPGDGEIYCDLDPCECAVFLHPWKANWGKMPK